jgi:hypothetical protein
MSLLPQIATAIVNRTLGEEDEDPESPSPLPDGWTVTDDHFPAV